MSGCSTIRWLTHGPASKSYQRRCIPPKPDLRTVPVSEAGGNGPQKEEQTHHLPPPPGLSQRALEVAEAIDVLPAVKQIALLEQSALTHPVTMRTPLLRARQQLQARVMLALLEVSGTAAEADCEQERADQLADTLLQAEGSEIKRKSLAGIAIGGLAAALAGGLALAFSSEAPGEIAAISGGLVSAAISGWAYFSEHRQELQHPRNLLKEVWEGPKTSTVFPRSVWLFLTQARQGHEPMLTVREQILASWKQEAYLGEPGSHEERHRLSLLFGEGGAYTSQELRIRAAMYDHLKSMINLMSQDLELLYRELSIREEQIEPEEGLVP
ncbi:MAG TPA: hypothetical protein VLA99_11120 [Nitrospiraceae bacterium]|nr:hypothetical protein [Nitrospiraceae bacterium]